MKIDFGKGKKEVAGEIVDGYVVRQTFIAMTNRLLSVSIFFGTYCRKNNGTVFVDIKDRYKNTIGKAEVDASRLQDNAFREFGLGVKLEAGKAYELRIWTMHCRSGQSVTPYYAEKTNDNALFIGARVIRDKELYCQFNYEEIKEEEPPFVNPELPGLEAGPPIPDGGIPGLVSIVIPHYNCHELLDKCLSTIARQSYSCIEVIVVDDGSEDQKATREIIKTYKHLIPAMALHLQENKGAPAARNAGAKHAIGEYLFFCDSDVFLYDQSIELLVRCLIGNHDADFAYGGFIWGNSRVTPVPYDEKKLKQNNFVTTMSLLRRAKFPGWDENLKRSQDWDLWLTVVDNGGKGVCCGQYLFETPMRENSITSEENIGIREAMSVVARKHALKTVQSTPAQRRTGLISVVIPCYNDELYLPKLLESIKGQTYNHYSVVVVDDCSDNGQAVLDACNACGFPVDYKRNPSRLGASESRNIGFTGQPGEFVFFCDADVILSPECFQEHIQTLHENPDSAWSYSNFSVGEEQKSFYPFSVDMMYKKNCSSTMSMVRSYVDPHFNPKLRRLQDWDMFISLMEKGHAGVWIDKFLFFAHDKPGITRSTITWDEAVKEMRKYHED